MSIEMIEEEGLALRGSFVINPEGEIKAYEIHDNGIGRKRSEELNLNKRKDHISFATNAIEKRLEILNLNKTNKITVAYIDKYKFDEAIGTTVIINIPTTWK